MPGNATVNLVKPSLRARRQETGTITRVIVPILQDSLPLLFVAMSCSRMALGDSEDHLPPNAVSGNTFNVDPENPHLPDPVTKNLTTTPHALCKSTVCCSKMTQRSSGFETQCSGRCF